VEHIQRSQWEGDLPAAAAAAAAAVVSVAAASAVLTAAAAATEASRHRALIVSASFALLPASTEWHGAWSAKQMSRLLR